MPETEEFPTSLIRMVISRFLAVIPARVRPRDAARLVERVAALYDEHGQTPYPEWLQELLREGRATGAVALPDVPVPPDAASAALSVLLNEVPEPGRGLAEALIPRVVESVCGAQGAKPPRWVVALRRRKARAGAG